MTSGERITAALHGEAVDHTPFSPFLAYVWEDFPREIQDAGQLAFHHLIGADPLWRGAACPVRAIPPEGIERRTVEEAERVVTQVTTPVGSFRFAHARSEAGNTSFLVEHPLKTEEDYKVRMWIEEHTTYAPNPEAVAAHFRGAGSEGLSLGMLIPRCKSAYQDLVEFFVGTEELIYAQVDFPDTVRSLLEMMVRNDLQAVEIALESDYDYFLTWEDSSTQNYSPTQYDEFIGSEIGEWCNRLDAVESISPPPTGNVTIEDARSMVGGSMGIIGGIEPTQFLNLDGSEFDRYVESVIDDGQGGPFVLANSDSCPPGVTVEKFRRVADIARTHVPALASLPGQSPRETQP